MCTSETCLHRSSSGSGVPQQSLARPGPGTADLDGAQTNTIQREKRADRGHQLGDSHLLDEEEGQWSQWEGEAWKVPSWKNIVVTVNLVLFGTRLNRRSQWLDRVWFLPSQIFVPKHDQLNWSRLVNQIKVLLMCWCSPIPQFIHICWLDGRESVYIKSCCSSWSLEPCL